MFAPILMVLLATGTAASPDSHTPRTKLYGGFPISYWQEQIKKESLVAMGEPDRVAALIEIVNDANAEWQQRRQAALTLGRVGPRAAIAVPHLIRLLNSGESDSQTTRIWALRGLSLIGTVGEEASPHVAVIARDATLPFMVRSTAIETLASVGSNRQETLPVLLEILNTSSQSLSAEIRLNAAEAIGLLGGNGVAAVPDLIRQLEQDDNPLFQRAVAQTLGKIGPRAEIAIPALLDVIVLASAGEAREAAAASLAQLGPDGILALGKLIHDPDPEFRLLGIHGLTLSSESSDWAQQLEPALTDQVPGIQVAAASLFLNRKVPHPKALEALVSGICSSDRSARVAAYRVLQQHPVQAQELKPRLTEILTAESLSSQSREIARKLLAIP
jgi:HEAT repeat protein